MKLSKVKIKSYKTIKEIELSINEISTLIVGKNNIGKSNVLKSLELFYNNLGSKKKDAIIEKEDYRFNTERVEVRVTFDDISNQLIKLKERIDKERSKRINKEILYSFELLYLQFETLKSQRNKLEVVLEIKRKNNSKNFDINYKPSGVKIKKYTTLLLKRNLFETIYPVEFTKLLNEKTIAWDFYKNVNLTETKEKYQITYGELSGEIDKSDYKTPKTDIDSLKSNVIQYLSETQRFLYVPAYRGEKEERNEILDRLFNIIIDDLITTRGVTKDYDTITDAIWGTGKFSNKQNIDSVISKRTESLIEKITKDSISSITGFEFDRPNRKEIRRGILKLMIGKPSLFLNDGVKTSFASKGTGIQSSFMITLMKALSEFEFINSTDILLVIEEPEAFTHPQLTREIMDLMLEVEDSNTQFIIASHSPVVVNYVKARNIVRLAEVCPPEKIKYTINAVNYDTNYSEEDWNLIDRITDVNLSEIVFADYVLFVEGEGDKAILELLLKEVLPKTFHKLSIVSISGNYQIFKLLKLLQYFTIPWILITDKDSFVDKTFEDEIKITLRNLDEFFTKYQISEDFKQSYTDVLNNHLVDKIISKSSVASGRKMGQLLKKIKDIKPGINESIKTELFEIITDKMNSPFITDEDSLKITNSFNQKMIDNEIPLYSLESDLEGFIVNLNTYNNAYSVYRKYFNDKADNFDKETEHFTPKEKVRHLRECLGSKTSSLKRIQNKAKPVKKPHIPIEIISDYLYENDIENLLEIFPNLEMITSFIKKKINSH
jgi:predicted ATP-dependent endonuclease of OLD family